MSDTKINNKDYRNRGVEVLLNKKNKPSHPFHIIFEKMIHLFKNEITVHFEFSINIRKLK